MRGMDQGVVDRAPILRATTASWLFGAVLVLCFLMFAPAARSASGSHAPGSLDRPTGGLPQTGGVQNRTHWKVQANDSITGTIIGATDSNLDGETQADVVIKSSHFGNTTVLGTKAGTTITLDVVATPPPKEKPGKGKGHGDGNDQGKGD